MYLIAAQQAVTERHHQIASFFSSLSPPFLPSLRRAATKVAKPEVAMTKEMLTINGGQVSVMTSPLSYCRKTDMESSSVTVSGANAAMTPREDINVICGVLNKKGSTRTITESDCAGAMFINGNCDNVSVLALRPEDKYQLIPSSREGRRRLMGSNIPPILTRGSAKHRRCYLSIPPGGGGGGGGLIIYEFLC